MTWLSYLFIIFGLSWCFVGAFRSYAVNKGMLDQPNGRSSHYAATARGGGIVFFVGWFLLMGTLYFLEWISYDVVQCFYPVLLVGFVGYWDDNKGLSAVSRFLFQCIAASAFLFLIKEQGLMIQPWLDFPWLNVPWQAYFGIMVIGIVWMTNLYNFMDGSDGMAAQEAIFFFGMGGYFLLEVQSNELAMLAFGLVALLLGFLAWNWPVARIFMGDSGSCFLGFTMAAYALISHKYFDIPLVIWAILTGLFWFDATITLFRRILKRENWREAHRLHAYQRLIQYGWSHQKVLFSAIVANGVLSLLAWVAFRAPRLEAFSFGLSVAFLTCLYLMVEIAKPMYGTWYEAK